MKFQTTFFRYITTAVAPATVLLGADSDPTTVYGTLGTAPTSPKASKFASAANIDNVISTRNNGQSAPTPVQRIAVAMCGPTGAASCTANLYAWDRGTAHWYLVNAAPVTLAQNTLAFFDAIAPCEHPQIQGDLGVAQSGTDYMLVVIPSGGPTAGQYSFTMTALLNTP